jgi:hypothetical protein
VSPDYIGSLLVIVVIMHTGLEVQLSVAETEMFTGTSLLSGGQSTFGFGDTEEIVGGCLSTTFTVPLQVAVKFAESVTVSVTGVAPRL